MIAKLKPYPETKNSGVEWLGEVPKHWEVPSLARVLIQRKEKNDPIKTKEILSLSLHKGVIPYADKPAGGNKAKEDLSSYMLTYPGDIVVNSMNVVVGSVGLSKYFGAVSPVYYMLRPRYTEDSVEFFDQVFQTRVFQNSLFGLGNGIMYVESKSGKLNTIRLRIPMTRLKKVLLPHPPPEEQTAIVRYLDYVGRRIRRLVRAKRKLIALLTEKKQAIIHRAVTRGLDPDVPLKDSGVEWLGEVPEHWEVKRGKYFFREVDVRSETGDEELLSVSHITGVTPRSQKNITMFKAESYVGSKICFPGQIAVNTMWAWMAAIGVSSYRGLISPSYHTYEQLDLSSYVDEYLDLLLRTELYKNLYTINSSGITTSRLRLYPDDFLNIRFLYPPRHEQEAILAWLHDTTTDIDTAITRASHEVELLNEYRTRLIADVVTGKLDVREAATALPEVDPLIADSEADDTLDNDSEEDLDDLDTIPEEDEA